MKTCLGVQFMHTLHVYGVEGVQVQDGFDLATVQDTVNLLCECLAERIGIQEQKSRLLTGIIIVASKIASSE